jgi:hypothetical protein
MFCLGQTQLLKLCSSQHPMGSAKGKRTLVRIFGLTKMDTWWHFGVAGAAWRLMFCSFFGRLLPTYENVALLLLQLSDLQADRLYLPWVVHYDAA